MKYFIIPLLLLFISPLFQPAPTPISQDLCGDSELCVVQFNAAFNSSNEVTWLNELTDCAQSTVDIMADPTLPAEYKIVVVPTILVLDNGEEVARFQANIMMTMEATREEVQESIDNIIMSKF